MKIYPLFFLFLVTAIGCTKKTDDGTAAHSATSSATVSHISVDHPIFAGVETCVYSNAAGAASYSWDFGDGQTSTLAKPCHTYSIAGTFTVTLTLDGDPARRASANAVVSPAPGFSTEIAGMHTWRHMLTVIGDTVTGDTITTRIPPSPSPTSTLQKYQPLALRFHAPMPRTTMYISVRKENPGMSICPSSERE